MKILKIFFLSILSIFITIYLGFLFVLPYVIDLNSYEPQITKLIQDTTGFQVELRGLRVKTAWNLSAGALIDKTDLKYPTGKKFAQINGLEVKLSLIPLIFRDVIVDKIDANKVLVNLETNEKGDFLLKDFLNKKSPQKCHFKFSNNMPDISTKKYRISIISGENKYSLKGVDLSVSDFILNKKVKLKTKGELVLNGRKQIAYNISLISNTFPKNNRQKSDFIKVLDDLYKYHINANINADLKIKNKNNGTDIDGKIDIDKISFIFGNIIYPESTLKLAFNCDKTKINASLHVDNNSKALITGFFKNGKNKLIDLHVTSDKINIEDIILIAKAMSKPFGIKNLQDINANGILKADFGIKSDFKKIESNGYLNIQDASVTNNLYTVSMNHINADIDFSQDAIKIKQAKANLNGQPITINGTIDKNANSNILISANDLLLKGVLFTLGQTKILRENDILGGLVNIQASLKGRLNKTSPKVSIIVTNVNLKNKKSKTQVKLTKATINSSYTKENTGKAEITDLKISSSGVTNISIPKINLAFDKKDLNIEKTYLYINNIKANLSGKISDISTNPRLNSVNISVPNQISVPIKGYTGSNITLKGALAFNGDLYQPEMHGTINIPAIRIPSASTLLKNITLQFNKDISINCPQMQIADSIMSFNALINKDFSKGIVAKNVNSTSNNIDLNVLVPIFKNLAGNSGSNITISNGKGSIGKFRVGGINASNITSNITLKNNILYLNSLRGDAYFGKIGGNVSYDFTHRKTNLQLQGRGLSANPAIIGLTGRNDDIYGQLDFDSNVSMIGYAQRELLHSLKGYTNFIISNGKMGVLGKFEHLIYAQNIISNSVFKATLNVIARAIMVKNTGVYRYMKGKIKFSDGWANITWIKTSGPSMSLYITGRYYFLDNTANLIMLGRISDDVVRILGPIGEFSMDKAISYIPKLGEITSFFANQFTTNPNYENISQIPYLTPRTEFSTKEFKVVIDGDIQKQSSVKSFKWLSRPKTTQSQSIQYNAPQKQNHIIPDFVKKLPDLKN